MTPVVMYCRVCGYEVTLSRAVMACGGHPACVYRRQALVASATPAMVDEYALRLWRVRVGVASWFRRRAGAR